MQIVNGPKGETGMRGSELVKNEEFMLQIYDDESNHLRSQIVTTNNNLNLTSQIVMSNDNLNLKSQFATLEKWYSLRSQNAIPSKHHLGTDT